MVSRIYRCNNNHGFTMIEVLFSLFIVIIITMSLTSILHVVLLSPKHHMVSSEPHIAASQLTNTLYTSHDIKASTILEYTDEDNKTFTIQLDNNRIIKKPGYVIFLDSVSNLSFDIVNQKVYMNLTYEENDYVFWIATAIETTNE